MEIISSDRGVLSAGGTGIQKSCGMTGQQLLPGLGMSRYDRLVPWRLPRMFEKAVLCRRQGRGSGMGLTCG